MPMYTTTQSSFVFGPDHSWQQRAGPVVSDMLSEMSLHVMTGLADIARCAVWTTEPV